MEISNITTPAAAILKFVALKLAPSLAVGAVTGLATGVGLYNCFEKLSNDSNFKPKFGEKIPTSACIGLLLGSVAAYITFNRLK